MTVVDFLEALYAAVPAIDCAGLCSSTCHDAIPVYGPEFERFEAEGLLIEPRERNVCPHLRDGSCTIYDRRPLVCRLHGAVDPALILEGVYEGWTCPHGCRPKRWLGLAEVLSLVDALDPSTVRSLDPDADAAVLRGRAAGYLVGGYVPLDGGRTALAVYNDGARAVVVDEPEGE